jgi:ADP-ribose pyrophosphatase YjhB (NUDIX family)
MSEPARGSRRIDHYYDPIAPKANAIVPSVSAAVINDAGEILLHLRVDSDYRALPGAAVDLRESAAQAVVREVREETGIDVEPIGIAGIYTDPNHVIEDADGDVRQQFSICFTARIVGGQLATGEESVDVRFVPLAKLDQLRIHPAMRLRIQHLLEQRSVPFFS